MKPMSRPCPVGGGSYWATRRPHSGGGVSRSQWRKAGSLGWSVLDPGCEDAAMKTRAAVALEKGKPLTVMDVQLDGPKAGEVLVEVKATGICHTDDFTLSGADPEGLFPTILGHEGAGVVVEVGTGVTSVEAGDHLIPLFTPACRQCPSSPPPQTKPCTPITPPPPHGA